MSLKALYAAFGLLALIGEVGLLALLIARRQYKVFPIFTLYIAFILINDVAAGALLSLYPVQVTRSIEFGLLPLEYLIELGVLLEITWNVLRPVHTSLPKGSVRVFVASVALALLGGLLLAWHFDHTGNK